MRGPNGGAAAGIRGPGGAAAGAVRGPYGGGAAGVRGPYGGAAGAAWGPGGYGVAGVRGPYGGRYVTNLPAGAIHYPWHGNDYWHSGWAWFTAGWVAGAVTYSVAYPPVGYYYPTLPPQYETVVINNTTYYESDNVYYQDGEQDGKKGYVVAESPVPPEESTQAKGPNPFEVLKGMCDYLAGLDKFSMVANTTRDEIRVSGDKVQVSERRAICVSRPDKVAIEVTGDNGARRMVYDGKTVSMLDRSKSLYTVVEVPNTIDAALDTLAVKYEVIVPLEDLMYKDLYDRVLTRITAGDYLGTATVNGLKCHHLAFVAGDSNWEFWIEAEGKPVLRKITIDYGQNETRSRYTADIAGWSGSPSFNERTFAFKLPENVKRFEMSPVNKGE
ncbi:MAG: DUF2092 domain-containing protein [Phycisphaerae bacterium]|nr:DUF2092 domain-containing protein [Phycisphaerae bacterium]